jgi:hypothetical protein
VQGKAEAPGAWKWVMLRVRPVIGEGQIPAMLTINLGQPSSSRKLDRHGVGCE